MSNTEFSKAFVAAQKEFGPALRNKNNPAFKAKYADLENCIDAVMPALNKHGIALLQEPFEAGEGNLGIETVFLHESGEERRTGRLIVRVVKIDPQGYGSAMTYARRYSLMAACGIAPEDDDGQGAALKGKQQPEGPSAELLQRARDAAINGEDSYRDFWANITAAERKSLAGEHAKLKEAAAKAGA